MIRIHAYVKNTFEALRSFSKGLFVILLMIAPLTGIYAICEGSVPQLNEAISHHPFSFTLFQWFCWFLIGGLVICAAWALISWVQKSLETGDKAYWFAERSRILMWTVLYEFIVYENVSLIFLNYWKHH